MYIYKQVKIKNYTPLPESAGFEVGEVGCTTCASTQLQWAEARMSLLCLCEVHR